jgi:hypothetical protein
MTLLGTIIDYEGSICLQTSPRVFYPLAGNSGIAADFQEQFNQPSRSDIGRQLYRQNGSLFMESIEQMQQREAKGN